MLYYYIPHLVVRYRSIFLTEACGVHIMMQVHQPHHPSVVTSQIICMWYMIILGTPINEIIHHPDRHSILIEEILAVRIPNFAWIVFVKILTPGIYFVSCDVSIQFVYRLSWLRSNLCVGYFFRIRIIHSGCLVLLALQSGSLSFQ